jgi:hypothetical protein
VSQPTYPSYPSQPIIRPAGSTDLRREAEAAVEARRDLGPSYDDAIAEGLADKVEQLVAYRMAELRMDSTSRQVESDAEKGRRTQRFVLGISSLGAGIPITAISASLVHPTLLGVLVSWAGIVGVNVAAAWNGRRRD